jgi:hypothetical protein
MHTTQYKAKYNIVLRVHPLLGKVSVKKLPQKPILGKQSDARVWNNR